MKIETKGVFEALPNCMSLQDIIDYLDSRNYDERKAKEEYHEMYEEGYIFPEVWKQVEPLIEGLPLVAHNKPFDEGCLKAVFRVYQMDYPDYEFYDTLCVSRRVMPELENHQLQTVAAACGYELEDHHHALADAEACAWIAREIL